MKKLIIILGLFTGLIAFGQNNMLDTSTWTVGSGSVAGFTRNGTDAENVRELGTTPYGDQDVIWKAFPDGVTSNSHGGWNTENIPIDHTKTYRYSVWMKKTNTANGSEVFGVAISDSGYQNALLKLDGTSGGNGIILSSIPDLNKWYLYIGYVYDSGHTGTISSGGIYDPTTGTKVSNGTDYKSSTAAVTTKHKAYLWNASSTSDALYFYGPTLYEVNGLEPTIQDLLNGSGGSDTQAPTPPTLTSTGQTSTTVDLSWSGATDNVGVTQYKVYKDNALVTTLGAVATYQMTGLIAGTTYSFAVRALDAAGNQSTASNLSVTTDNSTDTQAPTAPSLTSGSNTDTTVNLSWSGATDNVGVTGYKVYKDGILEASTGNVSTHQVTALTASTAYNFTVTALDAAGNESTSSNQVPVTTNAASGGGGPSSVWTESAGVVSYNGGVAIGTTSVPTGYKLAIEGKIRTREVRVDQDTWPDYVFAKDYKLPTLEEIKQHIEQKGHLPNVPSAEEVQANGIDLGEMNRLLLEKIEELTLYIIDIEKDKIGQKKEIDSLKKRLAAIENILSSKSKSHIK